jgi:hypothetical protein
VTGGETVAIDIKGDGKIDRTARLTTPAPGGAAPAEGGTCTMKAGTPQCTLTLQTQTVSVATNLKIGVSVESGTPVTSVTLESTVTLLPSPQERIAYWQGRMQALDLPVGWCNVETGATDRRWWCAGETVWEIGGPFRLPQRDYVYVGWLLTALAASLGAPFWFDLLKKVVNVRSSGVVDAAAGKPGQTQTGTSK